MVMVILWGVDERMELFGRWVERMMVKSLKVEEAESTKWVENVITPNGLTSVHELAGAANIELTPRTQVGDDVAWDR